MNEPKTKMIVADSVTGKPRQKADEKEILGVILVEEEKK